MSNYAKVIAIDGPSGSGKSTIAKIIANKLDLIHLDTGAMYRAVALHLVEKGIGFSDEEKIKEELSCLNFEYAKTNDILVSIDDRDLTEAIREHKVSEYASTYSQLSVVRDFLKDEQQKYASIRTAVLEGRDIGTVIFPDAALKIYLFADPKIRATRRHHQLLENNSKLSMSQDEILEDILKRDQFDENREMAPLKKASDALEIDSGNFSIDQVCSLIEKEYFKRKHLFQWP